MSMIEGRENRTATLARHINVRALLGVGGVPASENPRARRFGELMEAAVLFALALVFIQVFMALFEQDIGGYWVDLIIWAVFAVEFFGSLVLVDRRFRYVRYNWMNALIVLLAFPWTPWSEQYAFVFQSLRLLLILRFTVHFFPTALEILRRNHFGQILGLAALLVVFAGAMFAYLENRDFGDGLWWALVTITTVGYGDVVPQTEGGRIFGGVMILFGVVIFSLVTANIAAFLVSDEEQKVERDILRQVRQNGERLAEQEKREVAHLEQLIAHLAEMEQRQDAARRRMEEALLKEVEQLQKRIETLERQMARR